MNTMTTHILMSTTKLMSKLNESEENYIIFDLLVKLLEKRIGSVGGIVSDIDRERYKSSIAVRVSFWAYIDSSVIHQVIDILESVSDHSSSGGYGFRNIRAGGLLRYRYKESELSQKAWEKYKEAEEKIKILQVTLKLDGAK